MSLSIPVEARRIPSRCLILTVCLYGAFIYWSYNAGLVSLLTVENFHWPIKSLDDIVKDDSYRYFLRRREIVYSSFLLRLQVCIKVKSKINLGYWFKTAQLTWTFSRMQTKRIIPMSPNCGHEWTKIVIATLSRRSRSLKEFCGKIHTLSILVRSLWQSMNFNPFPASLTVHPTRKHTLMSAPP